MAKIETILLGTDFSEDSKYALGYARTLAERLGAKLIVMHVITNPTSPIYGEVEGDYLAMEKNAVEKSKRLLGEYDAMLKDLPKREIMVRSGEVVPVLLNVIKEKGVDTVVMGSHGHGALRHLLLGGTCEKVVRSLDVPVCVVRHPDRPSA